MAVVLPGCVQAGETRDENLSPRIFRMSLTTASLDRSASDRNSVQLLRPDWIVLLLPISVGMPGLNANFALLLLFGLAGSVALRKPENYFRLAPGPLILLFAATAMVIARPDMSKSASALLPMLMFLLVGIIAIGVTRKVDTRTIILSLGIGCGLYCAASLVLYVIGIRGAMSGSRIGGLVESTGFVRALYPLALTINSTPAVAAIFITMFPFIFRESQRAWRVIQLALLVAAVTILATAGSVAAITIATLVVGAVILFPSITRWIGQVTTLIAIGSVMVIPAILRSGSQFLDLVRVLNPHRGLSQDSLVSLMGRDRLWALAIRYWDTWLDDSQRLVGFGVEGHYRSGASATYAALVAHLSANPERAGLHNTYLQQLFDGGLIGVALLAGAIYWACIRFARQRTALGQVGIAVVAALTVLNLSAITEANLAPGPSLEMFWIMVVLVCASCQIGSSAKTAKREGAQGDG